jgi:hypothetical protein
MFTIPPVNATKKQFVAGSATAPWKGIFKNDELMIVGMGASL